VIVRRGTFGPHGLVPLTVKIIDLPRRTAILREGSAIWVGASNSLFVFQLLIFYIFNSAVVCDRIPLGNELLPHW
jgi:hypothetical protein